MDREKLTRRQRKQLARELLIARDIPRLVEWARADRCVIDAVLAHLYDQDDLVRWRAVDALGRLTADLANSDAESVRNMLRRLEWSTNDESGMINWHAPEAIASIIQWQPDLFADHVPIVVGLITNMAEEDLDHFRPGVLWAIGHLGKAATDHVREVLPAITAAFDDADAQVRGMAVWCLGRTGHARQLAERPELLNDDWPVDLYEDGELTSTSVGLLLSLAST